MKHELIVLGGGAAGLIAAVAAKDRGIDVAIVESNDRVGKKLLTTGNGRCNISNKFTSLNRYHSSNAGCFEYSLNKFTVSHTIDFFRLIGLPIVTLDDGKMFPMSMQASSVIDVFRMALEDRSIPVYTNCKITHIKKDKLTFKLTSSNEDTFECANLLIACGGKSAANTGSDGSIFKLVEKLGHNIVDPIPALVQLKLNHKNLKALSGIKFNGFAKIMLDGEVVREDFGEILFTDYGISGPPILQLSRAASLGLSSKKKVSILVDIMYSYSLEELENFLETQWAMFSHRSVFNSLVGIINKKLIPILLKEASITDIHKPCFDLNWKEKKNIYRLLKSWEFEVYETNSFSNAQVTAGGIDTTDVSMCTMESKLVKNLYFAGEILDVDGDCGGFNLQWCWSSGMLAAESIPIK